MRQSPEFRSNRMKMHLVTIILFIIGSATIEGTILLAGTTGKGMPLQGRIAGITDKMVFLESTQSGSQHQIGIPLVDTTELRIILGDSPDILVELEACSGLIPYLTEASRQSLMERILPLTRQRSWQLTCTWADRFASSAKSASMKLEARVERCHAMFMLGQFHQLESELAEVNDMVSPISAPARLCWVNASISLRNQLPEEASFWANLPFLQIPCYSGPLSQNLRELAGKAKNGQSVISMKTDQ